MNRFNSLRFELDFVEMSGDNVTLSITPEHFHRVGGEGNISRVASLKRPLKDNDGVSQVLISLTLDDIILCVVFENLLEV